MDPNLINNGAETRAAVALLTRSIRIVSEGDRANETFAAGGGIYDGPSYAIRTLISTSRPQLAQPTASTAKAASTGRIIPPGSSWTRPPTRQRRAICRTQRSPGSSRTGSSTRRRSTPNNLYFGNVDIRHFVIDPLFKAFTGSTFATGISDRPGPTSPTTTRANPSTACPGRRTRHIFRGLHRHRPADRTEQRRRHADRDQQGRAEDSRPAEPAEADDFGQRG
jgi:hypothetical protein